MTIERHHRTVCACLRCNTKTKTKQQKKNEENLSL